MRKAQVSMEFVLIMVFMMFLFAGLFVALQGRMLAMRDVQNLRLMNQIGNVVSNEVQLADQVGDGYRRDFFVPNTLYGETYNLSIIDGWDLQIDYHNQQYVTFLDARVTGAVTQGANSIRHNLGVVTIS